VRETTPHHDAAPARIAQVKSRHVEKHRLHGLACQPRLRCPLLSFRERAGVRREKKLAADLPRLRSQGHAHADLAAALCYGVTQHAHTCDGGEQQSYTGEEDQQQRRRTTRDKAIGNAGFHRPEVIDRYVGIDLPDHLLQRQPERFGGRLVRTVTKTLSSKRRYIGIINRTLGFVFGEPRLFHSADNANDRECFRILSRLGAFPHTLANSAAFGQ